MSKSKTPLKVLKVGRKRIAKGWMKGHVFAFNGGVPTVCALGALGGQDGVATNAIHNNTPQGLAMVYLQIAIGDHIAQDPRRFATLAYRLRECGFVALPGFNDHENTTHEDMLMVFDAAIAAAELDEGTKAITDTKPQAFEIDIPHVPDEVVVPDLVEIW